MKKIEVCYRKPSELKTNRENPREITEESLEDLKKSLAELDDFGIIVIDENDEIISGFQRVKAKKLSGNDEPAACKRLIGYTEAEKKIINLRANKQSGTFIEADFNRILEEINLEIGDVSLTGFEDINLKINKINEQDEWIGMPDFDNSNDEYKLIINFDTEKDKKDFIREYKIIVNHTHGKVSSARFPFEPKQDLKALRYE